MARRRTTTKKTPKFAELDPQIEDEILEVYSELIDPETTDFHLRQLPELHAQLKIPSCFTYDITRCLDYYYQFMRGKGIEFDASNVRQYTTLLLIQKYTVNANPTCIDDVIDIVDIDKLLTHTNKLIKFRNQYAHIYASWALFVTTANTKVTSEDQITNYKLSLPDLQAIKSALNIDSTFTDSLLIDMISACMVDGSGNSICFDYDRAKFGSCIMIKEFAEMLGEIGELE